MGEGEATGSSVWLWCLVKGKGDRGASEDSSLEAGRTVVPLTETEDKETWLGQGEGDNII